MAYFANPIQQIKEGWSEAEISGVDLVIHNKVKGFCRGAAKAVKTVRATKHEVDAMMANPTAAAETLHEMADTAKKMADMGSKSNVRLCNEDASALVKAMGMKAYIAWCNQYNVAG